MEVKNGERRNVNWKKEQREHGRQKRRMENDELKMENGKSNIKWKRGKLLRKELTGVNSVAIWELKARLVGV